MATRIGYSQVEPNHMSGMVTGQILAQLPVDLDTMGTVIENGRFAKYDYGNAKKVNLTGAGEWMMIYNEEKLPDERKQMHKDFAMVAKNYTGGTGNFIKELDPANGNHFKTSDYNNGEIVPRLWSVLLGDVWTTNAFGKAAANEDEMQTITLPADGASVFVGADGYLTANAADKAPDSPEFQCVKVYTMADGQPAVKLMRIK